MRLSFSILDFSKAWWTIPGSSCLRKETRLLFRASISLKDHSFSTIFQVTICSFKLKLILKEEAIMTLNSLQFRKNQDPQILLRKMANPKHQGPQINQAISKICRVCKNKSTYHPQKPLHFSNLTTKAKLSLPFTSSVSLAILRRSWSQKSVISAPLSTKCWTSV